MKKLTLLLVLLTCLSGYAQLQSLSGLFQAGNPLYLGNFAKNPRQHISFATSLKGEMIYKEKLISFDSLRLHNNILSDKNLKREYSIRHRDLSQITLIAPGDKVLRLFRIYPQSEQLFRELEQIEGLTFYDNYISFDKTVIDRYNVIIQYKEEFYALPKNKKKRQRMIAQVFSDTEQQETVEKWALTHM
ncbi:MULTISPECIES: hypothetical protein [unclassified Myroides]|uniref:hypothetical protein n=1 Tax=unclassified Myroides TaxID=2642485 RepID=UPI003D2F5845